MAAGKALGQEFRVENDAIAVLASDELAKRDQRAFAIGLLNLEQVACAEILDCHDRTERLVRLVDTG